MDLAEGFVEALRGCDLESQDWAAVFGDTRLTHCDGVFGAAVAAGLYDVLVDKLEEEARSETRFKTFGQHAYNCLFHGSRLTGGLSAADESRLLAFADSSPRAIPALFRTCSRTSRA